MRILGVASDLLQLMSWIYSCLGFGDSRDLATAASFIFGVGVLFIFIHIVGLLA